jgi:Na+:H+ antiporter, NhaA family
MTTHGNQAPCASETPTPTIVQIMLPFQEFFKQEASSGILLIVFTIVALVWANSPWAGSYFDLWATTVTVGAEGFDLSKPLLLWINDGLMAVFFFVVGLEIKREILVGELSSPRQAALPVVAALGGMLLPAGVYLLIAGRSEGAAGWGIPMATDIAFALGILSLVGKRAPLSLKVFLTAVAIVDDIGAVLVIALFYTAKISWWSLGIAALFFMVLIIVGALNVRSPLIYAVLGIGLWVAFLKSGVHATVAGVLLAMTVPARTRIDAKQFMACGRHYLGEFERANVLGTNILTNRRQQGALQALETVCQQAETPLQRFEHSLHPWVAYFIMPLFALANAGVALSGDMIQAATHPVTLGVAAGLILGKQLGILLAAFLVVRSGTASLPDGISWRHIYGAAWLAGIGFTMALFVSGLAFGAGPMLTNAKLGVLIASVVAGGAGWLILRQAPISKQVQAAK